jgi:hypothetical protein
VTLWTILIPTIAEREPLFRRLLDVLLPQLDAHGGAVRVLARRNAGELPVGELRDVMLAGTEGSEYVSWIDDDDLVPEFYVAEVVTALANRPDHVGYRLAYYEDGVEREIVDHSLRWRRWHRTGDGRLVRDFTHVDPVRREHATRGRFTVARRGRAEDRAWVKQVRPFLHTEAYIDRVMYHYLWSPSGSAWQRPERVLAPSSPLPAVDSPHFAWHGGSL